MLSSECWTQTTGTCSDRALSTSVLMRPMTPSRSQASATTSFCTSMTSSAVLGSSVKRGHGASLISRCPSHRRYAAAPTVGGQARSVSRAPRFGRAPARLGARWNAGPAMTNPTRATRELTISVGSQPAAQSHPGPAPPPDPRGERSDARRGLRGDRPRPVDRGAAEHRLRLRGAVQPRWPRRVAGHRPPERAALPAARRPGRGRAPQPPGLREGVVPGGPRRAARRRAGRQPAAGRPATSPVPST